jgi:hypothetical protein
MQITKNILIREGLIQIITGVVFIGLGIGITFLSEFVSRIFGLGFYFFAYGACISGAIQIFRGLKLIFHGLYQNSENKTGYRKSQIEKIRDVAIFVCVIILIIMLVIIFW